MAIMRRVMFDNLDSIRQLLESIPDGPAIAADTSRGRSGFVHGHY
jgi:hypothetical protein